MVGAPSPSCPRARGRGSAFAAVANGMAERRVTFEESVEITEVGADGVLKTSAGAKKEKLPSSYLPPRGRSYGKNPVDPLVSASASVAARQRAIYLVVDLNVATDLTEAFAEGSHSTLWSELPTPVLWADGKPHLYRERSCSFEKLRARSAPGSWKSYPFVDVSKEFSVDELSSEKFHHFPEGRGPKPGLRTWRGVNYSRKFVTTGPGAPPWCSVVERETRLPSTGKVIAKEVVNDGGKKASTHWTRDLPAGVPSPAWLETILTYHPGVRDDTVADSGPVGRTTIPSPSSSRGRGRDAAIIPKGVAPQADSSPASSSDGERDVDERRALLKSNLRGAIQALAAKRRRGAKNGTVENPVVKLWLIDTGCGHDLVSRRHALQMKKFIQRASKPINFQTAGGPAPADQVLKMYVDEFGKDIEPYILPHTPDVMSVGMRCMHQGFDFIWPSGEMPYFVLPNGQIVALDVIHDIPYLKTGARACQPKAPVGTKCFACGTPHSHPKAVAARHLLGEGTAEAAEAAPSGSSSDPPAPPNIVPEGAGPGGERPDDPADGGFVPEGAGEPDEEIVSGERRNLREEARSTRHLLMHMPKNPYCEACTRGKLRGPIHRKGSVQVDATHWGSHLVADYIVSKQDFMIGVGGYKHIFVIRDLFSRFLAAFATKTQSTEELVVHFKRFVGPRELDVHMLYSDMGKEIMAAMHQFKVFNRHPQPGQSKGNALAERANRQIIEVSRTLLEHAGMPVCFWPWAVEYAGLIDNLDGRGADLTPWQVTFGEEFPGKLVPFGAAVTFHPNERQGATYHKFDPRGVTGVFAGYEIVSGNRWGGHYYVWDLRDFVDKSLSKETPPTVFNRMVAHQVAEIRFVDGEFTFPLKSEYERVNHTLAGLRSIVSEDAEVGVPPAVPDVPAPIMGDLDCDRWVRQHHAWIRFHFTPRYKLFTPVGHDGGPSVPDLTVKRVTQLHLLNGTTRVIEDDWSTGSDVISDQVHAWTGTTTFFLASGVPSNLLPDDTPEPLPVAGEDLGPHRGEIPPRPLVDYGQKFYRRQDGVWCRADASGRGQPVDRFGELVRRSKTRGRFSYHQRPPEVTTEVWRTLKPSEKKEWWLEKFREDPSRDPGAAPAIPPASYDSGSDSDVCEGSDRIIPEGVGETTDAGDTASLSGDDPSDYPPWEYWEDLVSELETPVPAASAQTGVGCRTGSDRFVPEGAGEGPVPAMPVYPESYPREPHRVKNGGRIFPFNAAVARPVGKAEIARTPAAQAAMKKEWDRLRDKKVWDETKPREWRDVRREADSRGQTVHMGYLFGICVEKNAELDLQFRKYKGRVVFQGNRVVNQNYDAAIFQDLGSSPATLEAARAGDAYGAAPGHVIEVADAEQAYIQAEMVGTETWITLPPDQVPKSASHLRHPVFRLHRALYGHPDSGTLWEKWCDKHVKSVDFVPVGPEWPSCYFHGKLKLFLVIYVDDFKLSGPEGSMRKGWKLLRTGLNIEPEARVGPEGRLYLGCSVERTDTKLAGGQMATVISYNMEKFLHSCVTRYLELAHIDKVPNFPTPFLPEDHKESPAASPLTTGKVVECPWCCHTFSPTVHPNIASLDAAKRKQQPMTKKGSSVSEDAGAKEAGGGRLQSIAARVLMKVLWIARFARFDLLRAVGFLATQVTTWTSRNDRQLHRLIGYMQSTAHLRMQGWIGDPLDCLHPHLFVDADFAGCTSTSRSTSGVHLVLRGPRTSFPISAYSKRQGCVSHSTPEAEMVSLDFGVRMAGLPCFSLWEALLPHDPHLYTHEDNQAMLQVVRTGRNPTMRYLHRTHRVSVSWLHERFVPEGAGADHNLHIDYELTDRMCADIYTQIFTDPQKWLHACDLINVFDPRRFKQVSDMMYEYSLPPDSGGGNPTAKTSQSKASAPALVPEGAGLEPRDHWIVQGAMRIRVHATPRLEFYNPTTENGTPFSGSDLMDERVTTLSDGQEIRDTWKYGTNSRHVEPWTGTTTFFSAAGPPRDTACPRVRVLPGNLVAEARSLYRLACGMRRTHSSGWLWGACRDRGVPIVVRPGDEVTARLRRVTKILQSHLGKEVAFSTAVLCDSDAAELIGQAQPYGLGLFIPLHVDQDGGGHRGRDVVILKSGGKELKTCSNRMFHWPVKDMCVLPLLPKGRGVAVLSLIQSSAVKALDLYDINSLERMGCTYQWDHPTRLAAPAANTAWFIHCCCEPGSKLSSRASKDFEVLDVTKEDDFTRPSTVRRIKAQITQPGDAFYYSSPCTGGSSWQNLNLKRSTAAGCDRIVLKLASHFDLHWRLWAGFEDIVQHCARRGAAVVWEWPRFCTYWKEVRVQKLIQKYGFKFADFDGCMYGLSPVGTDPHGSTFIRKPWRIAYLNCSMGKYLHRVCDHSHSHHPCEGRDTILSQGYTSAICQQICRCLTDRRQKAEGRRGRLVSIAIELQTEESDLSVAACAQVLPVTSCEKFSFPSSSKGDGLGSSGNAGPSLRARGRGRRARHARRGSRNQDDVGARPSR